MKKYVFMAMVAMSLAFISSCGSDDEIDKEAPVIDIDAVDAFPINCDTLYFGETFYLKVAFSDNAELGSFSLDIHNNFDHHSHSTEVTECSMGDKKEAVNAFTFIEDYDIPEGSKEYETNLAITLPSGNSSGSYDEGDYHFFISLTDKEGWSAQKGLSIKILKR